MPGGRAECRGAGSGCLGAPSPHRAEGWELGDTGRCSQGAQDHHSALVSPFLLLKPLGFAEARSPRGPAHQQHWGSADSESSPSLFFCFRVMLGKSSESFLLPNLKRIFQGHPPLSSINNVKSMHWLNSQDLFFLKIYLFPLER